MIENELHKRDAQKLREKYTAIIESWIVESARTLPAELRTKDLINLGFFGSIHTLKNANSKGHGPKYTKTGRVCRYKRADVLEWVRSRALTLINRGKA